MSSVLYVIILRSLRPRCTKCNQYFVCSRGYFCRDERNDNSDGWTKDTSEIRTKYRLSMTERFSVASLSYAPCISVWRS